MTEEPTIQVPVALLKECLRDLCSPFPKETQVVAALKTGNTSIEKLAKLLGATIHVG